MLVDARRTAPVPALFSALRCLQVSKQCFCIKDCYGLYCLNILFWNCSKITVPAVLLSYFSGISLNIKMYYILMYKQMYFVFLQEKNSSVHTVLLLVDKDSSYMRVDKRTLPQVSDSLR